MSQETCLDTTQEKSKVECSSRFEQVYAKSERIAELHAVLTSPRGDHFRARLEPSALSLILPHSGV